MLNAKSIISHTYILNIFNKIVFLLKYKSQVLQAYQNSQQNTLFSFDSIIHVTSSTKSDYKCIYILELSLSEIIHKIKPLVLLLHTYHSSKSEKNQIEVMLKYKYTFFSGEIVYNIF